MAETQYLGDEHCVETGSSENPREMIASAARATPGQQCERREWLQHCLRERPNGTSWGRDPIQWAMTEEGAP